MKEPHFHIETVVGVTDISMLVTLKVAAFVVIMLRGCVVPKESSKNNSINLSYPRPDGIVPIAMESSWQNGKGRHLFIRYLASGGIGIGVELALHRQASLCRGRSDQLHDYRIASERLAAPVLTDPGKEAMLNLVPFARAWRQVRNGDRQTCFIRQLLQFPFPQAHARAIASSSIGADEQPLDPGILRQSNRVPPAPNAFYREGGGIVIHPHIDPARILSQVIHPIGSRSSQARDGEVVDSHLLGFPLRTPFTPRILEISHQFFLFRIH